MLKFSLYTIKNEKKIEQTYIKLLKMVCKQIRVKLMA